jgi:signal transduction histidine kinase
MESSAGPKALAATKAAVGAARDALAQARAQRDELLVLASHDIRNAVGILDSALSMIEDGSDSPSMHGMMRRSAHRLGILVKAMVDVDLLERELMPLTVVDTRWKGLVEAIVEHAAPAAATKDLQVVATGDLDAVVACDAVMVERMVVALVDHAMGDAPAGTAVEIASARTGEHRFAIRVSRGGRAIAAEAVDKYFTTLPLRFCRLAAMRHGGVLNAGSVDGAGLLLALEIAG